MAISRDTKKRYERRVQKFLNQNKRLTNKEANNLVKLVKDTKEEVVSGLRNLNKTEFQAFQLPTIKQQLDNRLNELSIKMRREMNSGQTAVFDAGLDKADEMMRAAGIETSPIFIDPTVLETTKTLTSEMVSTVPQNLKKKLSSTLAVDMMQGKSMFEVIEDIERDFKLDVVSAERIARTEIMRTQSIAQEKRFQQVFELNPVYLKRWIWSGKPDGREGHREAEAKYSANPIPFNDMFRVRPTFSLPYEDCQFPRDPVLGAANSVNCGCIHVIMHPEDIGRFSESTIKYYIPMAWRKVA